MRPQPDLSRRFFLRGKKCGIVPARPPWSVAENLFLELCTRCGMCIENCPNGLLKSGSGGFPEADFTKATCNFCGDCTQACHCGALIHSSDKAWDHTPVIGDGCLARKGVYCRTCAEACDDEVIRFQLCAGGMAEPKVEGDRCRSCGECSSSCPVMAIELKPKENL